MVVQPVNFNFYIDLLDDKEKKVGQEKEIFSLGLVNQEPEGTYQGKKWGSKDLCERKSFECKCEPETLKNQVHRT